MPSAQSDSKRRRVTLACNRCRSQKLRCDGNQPTCGRCQSRKTACDYPKKFVRANVSEDYVRHLEMTLGIVQCEKLNSSQYDNTKNMRALSLGARELPPRVDLASSRQSVENSGPVANCTGEGSPSAFSLMCLVEAALGSKQHLQSKSEVPVQLNKSPPMSGLYSCILWLPTALMKKYELPPRSITDGYIQKYLDHGYAMCPFMHRQSFLAAYDSVRKSSTAVEPILAPKLSLQLSSEHLPSISPQEAPLSPFPETNRYQTPNRDYFYSLSLGDQKHIILDSDIFYVILRMILAIGCLYTRARIDNQEIPIAHLQYEKAAIFYDQLVEKHGETSSLILLQALLLQAQFLLATHQRESCRLFIAKAMRVAQELGLYDEQNIVTRDSSTERELCRRLWYGCLVLDRNAALIFGMPMVITRSFQVNLPQLLESNYVTERSLERPPQEEHPTIMSFFEQTIKLYGILADVLRDLYFDRYGDGTHPEETQSLQGFLTKILEFDDRLGSFQKGLPDFLVIENLDNIKVEDTISRKATILHLRYLHVIIMVYRSALLPNRASGELQTPECLMTRLLLKRMSKEGIECSIELINALCRLIKTNKFPDYWYIGFYVNTAAVMVLSAMILEQTGQTSFNMDYLDTMWKRSVKLLEDLHIEDEYIIQAAAQMTRVYSKIDEKTADLNDVSDLGFLPLNSNEIWGFDVDMLFNVLK